MTGNNNEDCIICHDKIDPQSLRRLHCGDCYCSSCIDTYVRGTLQAKNSLDINCPLPSCNQPLNDFEITDSLNDSTTSLYTELKQIQQCAPDALERKENKQKEALQRFQELIKDPQLKTFIFFHLMPCPSCYVLVERSMGCSQMTCICGCNFCFMCGWAYTSNRDHVCRSCHKCKLPGHHYLVCQSYFCPKCKYYHKEKEHVCYEICMLCKRRGHDKDDCPSLRCTSCKLSVKQHAPECQIGFPHIMCKRCHKPGHRLKYCKSIFCYVCYKFGDHEGDDCPQHEEEEAEVEQCQCCGSIEHELSACEWNDSKTLDLIRSLAGVCLREDFEFIKTMENSASEDGNGLEDQSNLNKETPKVEEKKWQCPSCQYFENKTNCSVCANCGEKDRSSFPSISKQKSKDRAPSLSPQNGYWFSRHLPSADSSSSGPGSWDVVSTGTTGTVNTTNSEAWETLSVSTDTSEWDSVSVRDANEVNDEDSDEGEGDDTDDADSCVSDFSLV